MNIVKENRIVFKRLADINVTAYKILGKQTINGESVTTTLATIPNPSSPTPVKIRKKFDYNPKLEFEIKDEVFYNDEHDVAAYINGRKLIDVVTLYNPSKRTVTLLYQGITEFDIIEIEYYYDGIEFIHDTDKPTEYIVELVVDYTSNNVGDHNILI
jgi:hypothetical protein